MHDVIVVGAGPAGVSAALYAKARGLEVLVLEKYQVGGLISGVSKVSHYASVGEHESGQEFASKLSEQLDYSQIPVQIEEVNSISKTEAGFKVISSKAEYEAKTVILAIGSTLKELDQDKFKDLPTEHWPLGKEELYKGKTVVINGGSDGASKEALYLAQFAKCVHMVQDQDRLLCISEFKKQIEVSDKIITHTSATLESYKTEGDMCTEVVLSNGESIRDSEGIVVFVQIGQHGNADLLESFSFETQNGFVQSEISTDVDGLYLAGDIRVKPVRQIATAVADGCLAGIEAAKKAQA